jgi:hypothetical protein
LLTTGCKSWGKFWCVDDAAKKDPTCPGYGATNDTKTPTTPADLAAANAGGAAIRLTWAASKDDTTPQASIVYEICQTTTSGGCSGGSFSVTYTVTGQTSYTTAALTNGTTYFFTIRAKDANGLISSVSPQVRATAATNPQWQQTAYLNAPNAENFDYFGRSVAISGDTIVVGAYGEDSSSTAVCNAPFGSCGGLSDNSASAAGAAYVFERDGSGNWQQKAYLKAPNAQGDDWFGYSVAISGDTIVVGALQEDGNSIAVCNEFTSTACDNAGGDGPNNNGASYAGAAYVFERDGSGAWQQKAYLKAPNTGANDGFGESVAISGDTIVVGALSEDSNSITVCNDLMSCPGMGDNMASASGAAYVFERDGSGNWQQKAYLKAPNTDVVGGDYFGVSVAISGHTIVVGALSEDSNSITVCNDLMSCPGMGDNMASASGAAYVFERK